MTPATEALEASGIDFELTEHGPVRSLEEAAAARGLEPWRIIKTIVVRRGEGDFLFVLVPGDREISWPKLRSELGVSRLSMPDKDVARVPMKVETLPFSVEQLTWSFLDLTPDSGRIAIMWGKTMASAPFTAQAP